VVSINDEVQEHRGTESTSNSVRNDSQPLMSDEELARMLQARPLIWLIFSFVYIYLVI
jgi:hypothetical protein